MARWVARIASMVYRLGIEMHVDAARRAAAAIGLLATALCGPTLATAQAGPIAILSTVHPTYQQAADSAENSLKAAGQSVVQVSVPKGSRAQLHAATATQPASSILPALQPLAEAAVVLTVGDEATYIALEALPKTPVVFCMIPNALDMPFLADDYPHRSRLTGVTTDTDGDSLIGWAKSLCPNIKTLCIPCSARSRRTAGAIEHAARKHAVQVVCLDARKDQFGPVLQQMEEKGCDGAIMIADAEVYNSDSVRQLLLWSLRGQKPVWTFTPNIVEAGALACQFVEPAAVGQQAAEIAVRVASGTSPARIGLQYPRLIRTAINERTGEIIGLRLDPKTLERIGLRYGQKQE